MKAEFPFIMIIVSNQLPPNSWIKDKICLITGANAGIGKETAVQLAERGAHVVMLCRNADKGRRVQQEIIAQTQNPHIDLMICDLANLHDLPRFVTEFRENYSQLHVLINNAGIFTMTRSETQNGYERTFAVNYLAHFYLTLLLLPLLKQSAPARIINLSSNIHSFFKIKMGDVLSQRKYRGYQAYSNSKSAMILFTYKLARLLQPFDISVNAVHPGYVKTQITARNMPQIFAKIARKVTTQLTPAQGAASSVLIASMPYNPKITGKYFSKGILKKSAKFTYRIPLQEKLWKISEILITKAIKIKKISFEPSISQLI